MTQEGGILTTIPTIPFDEVKFPSGGLYYNNTKTLKGVKSIKVPYLTGREQDVLLSPSVLESGEFVDTIIDMKLAEVGINPDELLPGDINAILIFLRSTGVGDIYDMGLQCPLCKSQIEDRWKLSELKSKDDIEEPDGNGLLKFITPVLGHEIIFGYLSRGEDKEINDAIQDRIEKLGEGAEALGSVITTRMNRQIKSIGGNTDPLFITDYMAAINYKDKMELRKFMVKNEPGIELTKTVPCVKKGCEFQKTPTLQSRLTISAGFFWPDSEL